MFDLNMAGVIITPLVLIDILVHFYFDYKKLKSRVDVMFRESGIQESPLAIGAVAISTLGSMAVILAIILSWVSADIGLLSPVIYLQIFEPPRPMWMLGLAITVIGLLFHMWSRVERGAKAISWDMSTDHELVTTGPYSLMRHPSYSSYIMIFIGLSLLIPSLVTLIFLIGIPGYYSVAKREEVMLVKHFGDRYTEYQRTTGMLLPKPRGS